jgi:uncharacterized oligopeptide transporter (OPT) family protein
MLWFCPLAGVMFGIPTVSAMLGVLRVMYGILLPPASLRVPALTEDFHSIGQEI